MNIEDLNACLRGELASIETYGQALEKIRGEFAQDARFQQLTTMLQDHREAAARLRSLIQQMGGVPTDESGAWGTWSKTVMGTAKLLGDKAALKALKEGEESGVKQYQGISQDPSSAAEVRNAAAEILTRHQEHVRELDLLIEAA